MNDVYFDVANPACYTGVNPVYYETKKRFPAIKHSDVETFLHKQDTYTLHKPIRRKFNRNRFFALGIDSDWQADLCDVQKIRKYNDGFGHILTVIDVLSKFAWAVPITNKKPEAVVEAFRHILKMNGRKPWRLFTDKGMEFRGKPFQDFLKKQDIQYIASESPDIKAGVAERYNRTLKSRIWKRFTQTGSLRYLEDLPKIVDAINHSYHRSIKCRPIDVTLETERKVWETLYGQSNHIKLTKFKFKVGDKVRIAQYKHTFKKGYLPNFTEEIFTITDAIPRQPPVYKIKDWNSEPVVGIFYESELVKVDKTDNIYKIEEILKTRKRNGVTEHFVKWSGYPNSFNQWIQQTDLKST
ncbi:MAG: DDE-type integrase/transposase/recombinase [Desulfobacterales bacterium]|nr:DDE-type integrase/transposase/recombinase [Desulfobacterales bacterium]